MANTETTEIRQIHFNDEGVGYGIVGKDHLDANAFELAAGFTSNLAARYTLVDGVVLDAFEDKTDDEVLELLVQAEAARAAALVDAKLAFPKIVTKLVFMNLFTEAELEVIYAGSKASVALEVYLDKMKVADNVDLNDARTVAGLNKLVAAGILTAERVLAIRTGVAPQE